MPVPAASSELGDRVVTSFDENSLLDFDFIDRDANGLCRRWKMTRMSVAVTQSVENFDKGKILINMHMKFVTLENCGGVEVSGRRSPLQSAESDSRALNATHAVIGKSIVVQTAWLLLVEFGNLLLRWAPVKLLALRAVELEGLPRLAVIGALINCHRVGLDCIGAEKQTDVGQLELFTERKCQSDIVGGVLEAAEIGVGKGPRFRPPARHIIEIVNVRERSSCEAFRRVAYIARVAFSINLAELFRTVAAAG